MPEMGLAAWNVGRHTLPSLQREGFTAEAQQEVGNIPTFWTDLPTLDQRLHTGERAGSLPGNVAGGQKHDLTTCSLLILPFGKP
jgi:hypothetical protein